MNASHGLASGRFCTREDGRRLRKSEIDADSLTRLIIRAITQNPDCLGDDAEGTCLIVDHNGDLELLCLSAEGREAYLGRAMVGIEDPNHNGRCYGEQDGHNIRRTIRRWCARNTGLEADGLALKVTRNSRGMRLSAVAVL